MNIIKRLNQLSAQLDHVHPQSKHPITALTHSRLNNSHSISTLSDLDPQKSLRLSASLIIIKPLESTTPDGFNYQTLLIQRNSSQRSFSSAYVFPGGNLDPNDHNHQSLIQKSNEDQLDDALILENSLKICAIRETFEESGILIGLKRAINHEDSFLQNLREKLTSQLAKFNDVQDYIPSDSTTSDNNSSNLFCLNQLSYFANILTPNIFTKRWDTHFYLTILPSPVSSKSGTEEDKSSLEPGNMTYLATPNGTETVLTTWLSPGEALRRCLLDRTCHSDHIIVAPPQFYLLSELSQKKDYRELTDFQNRMVPPFTPELVKLSDDHGGSTSCLTLPGDSLHSSSDKLLSHHTSSSSHLSSFKNRIYVQNESNDFGNQSGKFFRPTRAQRYGMQTIFGSGWNDLN